MENQIFREKSLERVSSPEELNDYIRVTTPSVWIILAAVVFLLLGLLVWAVFGRIDIHDQNGNVKSVAPITFVTN
ncbi:MAG: hypothetical protein K6G83_16650 [Lachnospiraceae bacterium]|nr:hypothetical protein [Lachnospiraceae bacterium]